MNGWTKFYLDGSKYIGEDKDVRFGRASWRHSSNENLVKVELHHEGCILQIEGPGQFWQSDQFESMFPAGSTMVKRRIQRLITQADKYYVLTDKGVSFLSAALGGIMRHTRPILPNDIGKWITLEYDIRSRSWRHYISKGRL